MPKLPARHFRRLHVPVLRALLCPLAAVAVMACATGDMDDRSASAPPSMDDGTADTMSGVAGGGGGLLDPGAALDRELDDGLDDSDDSSVVHSGAVRRTSFEVGPYVFDARHAGPEDGELVVLLHGFPQTSYCYREALSVLGEAGYHAVAPDLRGYSEQARPTEVEDYRIELLVGDVLGIVGALGVERFHLVGHDWGGVIAWKVAADHGARLHSLTVLSTPHIDALRAAEQDPSSDQAMRSAFLDRFTGEGGARSLLALGESGLRLMYTGIDPDDIEYYVSQVGNEEVLDNALNYRRANGISPIEIGPIAVDTLYVHGADDQAFGPDAAAGTADHIDADYRFESLEGVNHWVPDIEAQLVGAWILQHVQAH